MFKNLGEKFQQFMVGRNGSDDLGRFTMLIAIVFLFVSFFSDNPIWDIIVFALLAYSYWRMISRNTQKRFQENLLYRSLAEKPTNWLRSKVTIFQEHLKYGKTHRFFSCPSCGQQVKVPKGKGKIRITCPRCKTPFEKKS